MPEVRGIPLVSGSAAFPESQKIIILNMILRHEFPRLIYRILLREGWPLCEANWIIMHAGAGGMILVHKMQLESEQERASLRGFYE